MGISLRDRLLAIGINGHEAQRHLNNYLALCRVEPTLTVNGYLKHALGALADCRGLDDPQIQAMEC